MVTWARPTAVGTTHGEVAGVGAAHGEVAGCACWHALCQAKEISLVVAAVGTAHSEVAGVGAAHSGGRGPRRGRGVRVLARALSGKGNRPGYRGGRISYCRMKQAAGGLPGRCVQFFEG